MCSIPALVWFCSGSKTQQRAVNGRKCKDFNLKPAKDVKLKKTSQKKKFHNYLYFRTSEMGRSSFITSHQTVLLKLFPT